MNLLLKNIILLAQSIDTAGGVFRGISELIHAIAQCGEGLEDLMLEMLLVGQFDGNWSMGLRGGGLVEIMVLGIRNVSIVIIIR